MKINMKGLFCASLIFASSLPSCGSNPQPKKTAIAPTSATTAVDEPILAIETSEGIITVKLYKETPLHRDNFVKLAAEGFYDGIIFHRVIRGFMIQTGDPQSKNPKPNARYGTGGPGYNIPAEILPQLKHKKGALAAARTGDHVNPKRESSGSQFYIVENPASCAQLDGAYTVFGETISGFDVIDKIAATATDAGDRPVKDVIILSVKPVKK
jgi:cyclophilin family peptidyl-prolyl cis-trans isomerase